MVLDVVPERLEMAKRFGADVTLNTKELPDSSSRFGRLGSNGRLGRRSGHRIGREPPSSFPAGLKMLRKGGQYCFQGNVFPGAKFECDAYDIITRG